jgi:hypothetical protein
MREDEMRILMVTNDRAASSRPLITVITIIVIIGGCGPP